MNYRKLALSLFLSTFTLILAAQTSSQGYKMQKVPIQSRWAKLVSPANALKEYPRPQLVRGQWQNLNGLWEYAITSKDASSPSNYEGKILVPYPIESALSGVKKMVRPTQNLWYKRRFSKPAIKGDEKVLLHFGAVDWQATVFVNGKEVGEHTGGYQEFSFDITDALKNGENEIMVKVYDPTDQGPNPHGKQVLEPKDIWYTPVTGIWQTVWLETVPGSYIESLKLTPDIDKGVLNVKVNATERYDVVVSAVSKGHVVSTRQGKVGDEIVLPIKDAKLWSPESPFLYDLKIKLVKDGKTVDEVSSYFGMRKVEIKKDKDGFDRIFFNNKYVFNLGTLDQGFWPDGIYTAPTDEALKFDIEAIKAMGFNVIRKHIKREPARWYYHCDKLGMMVWQDMINPSFNLTDEAKLVFERECKENIEELYNYPCITTYTLFNEKWGQYDQERLTKWIKELDPTRLVNGHSGEYLYVNEKLRSPSPNAYVASDITDVHSYPDPMNSIQIDGMTRVVGEFGGIGVFIPDHQWNTNSAWGYIQVTPSALKGKYTIMNQHLKMLEREGLSASIYTQPFDVEGEQNGLMTYDREVVKIPFAELRKIHSLLVPTAKNIPLVAASNADLTDPGIRYSQLLQRYINGERQAEFLKKLAIAALQVGDKPGVQRANTSYFAALRKPYTNEDLQYVLQVTQSTKDAGFAILKENAEAINEVMGPRQAEVKLMNAIYTDEIAPNVSGENPQPDWAAMAAKINLYGAVGEEILLRAKTIHFLNAQQFNEFAKAASEYVAKFGEHVRAEELNQFAWTTFERVKDTQLLLEAAKWSKLSLKDKDEPAFLDTQANLLYKAGKKDEAIALQERAVKLSNGNVDLKSTLEKMENNQPTWPQN